MKEYNEKERKLLTEMLPNAAREARGAMATLYSAVKRIVSPEDCARSEKLDKDASLLWQSYYRMCRLVNNLTDTPLLVDTSKFKTLVNGDIVGLARDVCEQVESLFRQRGVEIVFKCAKETQIIAMDVARLERMLLNLLSNALKFTPAGGTVTVRVRVAERFVYLSVSDTGCGIAPEKLEHIFERFLYADPLDLPPHGVGLGLALCRRIAQGHGGSIVAESAVGKGTTFTVSLPNERMTNLILRAPQTTYDGGFNRVLLELSDALPAEAFLHQYLD